MTYINGKYGNDPLETIDQFDTRKDARIMLREYRLAMPYYVFWLSQRSTKDWRETQ